MRAVFFPRNDYPNNIEVCAHRLGKKMTYTEQTDGVLYNISYRKILEVAKDRNIKIGCFINSTERFSRDALAHIRKDENDNRAWFDIYSMTESLRRKIVMKQSISKDIFDDAYLHYLLPFFMSIFGRRPVACSYAYGNDTISEYVSNYFLGARNSGHDKACDYGLGYGVPLFPYTVDRFKSKQSSTRWYDCAKSNNNNFEKQISIQSSLIDICMEKRGWLNNFTHFHNYFQDGNEKWAEKYFDLLAQKNANNDIYFAGYGEALAYLVYRQMITKYVMYTPSREPNKLIIRLEVCNNFNIDTRLLQIPISIKFSTVRTPLEGENIHSNCVLNTLSDNLYIVEIPYDNYPCAEILKC